MTTLALTLLLALQTFELTPVDERRFEDLQQDVTVVVEDVGEIREVVARLDERTLTNTRLIWALLAAVFGVGSSGAVAYRKLTKTINGKH